LCAIRKSRTATLRAQKRQREKASRMGVQVDPEAAALAEYVLVLPSLPAKPWPADRVLRLYRCRWQVELVFKRLKSLLGLGHLPKTNDQSARSWMQAKILTALLIERAMYEARFFPPGATHSKASQWAQFREMRDCIVHVLAPALPLRLLLRRGRAIARRLQSTRSSHLKMLI
jgi:hypothetical protein